MHLNSRIGICRPRATVVSIVGLATLILLAPSRVPAQALYHAVEMMTIPEGGSRVVRSVNDAGDAVGGGRVGPRQHAFAMRGGRAAQVPGLPASDYSVATGINDIGEVVGTLNTGTAVRAFRATGAGSITDLTPLPGDTGSEAFAVNNAGHVVGASSGPGGMRAVIWSRDGSIRALPPVRAAHGTRALAVNDAGDAAGLAVTGAGPRAVAWLDAAVMLAALPGHRNTEALGINSRRQIVGSSEDASGVRHAVLWSPGKAVQDLGSLAPGSFSRAFGINDRTEIVGASETRDGSRAFLWTPADGMRDLNGLLKTRAGFVLTQAVAISRRGVILAVGEDEATTTHEHAHDHHDHPMRIFVLFPQP